MKLFSKIFRSQASNILINLKVAILELRKMQHDVERLVIMEQNLPSGKKPLESIVSSIRDSFGVALWIKDENHKFIFANKVCCDDILKCREDEFEHLIDEDFEKDALAKICIASDKLVMEAKKTMRFIEYATYVDGNKIVMDVVKSPRFEEGEVVGTIGSGVIVTDNIPTGILEQGRLSHLIEIPLNVSMGPRIFAELLERRRDGKRAKSDDEAYRRKRKGL